MLDLHVIQIVAVICSALAASGVAAVAGFGGAVLLMPALVWAFGVREAVPILTIAQLVGNGSRVWFNRSDVHRPVVLWYSLGAVPCALLGGLLFATAPLPWLSRGVGGFLVTVFLYRRLGRRSYPRVPGRAFWMVGAVASMLSALVGSTGPLTAPFFLSCGLAGGAYIGTEAAATVITHVFKLIAYGGRGILQAQVLLTGLLLAPVMVLGSLIGKRVLDRLSQDVFAAIVEWICLLAGTVMLVRG